MYQQTVEASNAFKGKYPPGVDPEDLSAMMNEKDAESFDISSPVLEDLQSHMDHSSVDKKTETADKLNSTAVPGSALKADQNKEEVKQFSTVAVDSDSIGQEHIGINMSQDSSSKTEHVQSKPVSQSVTQSETNTELLKKFKPQVILLTIYK